MYSIPPLETLISIIPKDARVPTLPTDAEMDALDVLMSKAAERDAERRMVHVLDTVPAKRKR